MRSSSKPRKLSRDNDSASSSLSPVHPTTPGPMDVDEKASGGGRSGSSGKDKKKEKADGSSSSSDSSSSDEDDGRPPRPAPPASQTFGEDPSTFPDPTVYEIREITPDMTDEEVKRIYSVASFPHSDLHDVIAGDPPDKDFSSAKPSNQISASTFQTYVDPYFRPFTEEDLAFLRERGDRATPFGMPKRGSKHYTQVWAEEDGSAMSLDSPVNGFGDGRHQALNQPRGSIENMDDEVAETDGVSVGPVLSRLLQAMRPEHRVQTSEDGAGANGVNGVNGDGDGGYGGYGNANGVDADGNPTGSTSIQPATYMTESATEAWKRPTGPKLEYHQLDERVKQELRHIGFLDLEAPFGADYDGAFDDEVAARLRVLQTRLREQLLINGARKARLADLVREHMAHQEYATILEDLDGQVNGAYLKRTRTMGKSKKAKRPGGAGGGSHYVGGAPGAPGAAGSGVAGMARPGIGDVTRTLMERRRRWIDSIGAVFDDESLNRVPRLPKHGTGPGNDIWKQKLREQLERRDRRVKREAAADGLDDADADGEGDGADEEPDGGKTGASAAKIPTVFKKAIMADLMRKEKAAWEEEADVLDEADEMQ